MKNISPGNRKIFWLSPIIALGIGFLPMPYGYYMLSRLVVSGCALYFAFNLFKTKDNTKLWIFGFIVVLYNPLIPIHLGQCCRYPDFYRVRLLLRRWWCREGRIAWFGLPRSRWSCGGFYHTHRRRYSVVRYRR